MDPKVKEIIEKVKLTAKAAAEAAGKAAEAAGKKAEELFEVTKINLKIFDLNNEIEILYKEIGRLLYHAHLGTIDEEENDIQEKLERVDSKNAEIVILKSKINEKKNIRKCAGCERVWDKDFEYCPVCGAKL